MVYGSILLALSLANTILSPIISLFLPLNKDLVLVGNELQLEEIDQGYEYPVLHFIALVEQHGYTAEEHFVKTSDGYILQIHRITGNSANPKAPGKPVAYLQHGLLQSSDSFVLIGPDHDLAFQLVNAGYDVWLGNARGNTYSKSHVSKSSRNKNFWDFTFHEIALYDLPAVIDRILEVSHQKSLTYYGISMGTTVSYVLLSMRPEYNEKINMIYSLAPVAYWKYGFKRNMQAIDTSSDFIKEFFVYFDTNQLLPQTALVAYLGSNYCSEENRFIQPVCAFITCQFFALDYSTFNKTALPTILAHNPAGTSRMVLLHLNQNMERGSLQPYDYDERKNIEKYGQARPPIYNLTNIKVPVSLWYGKGDDVINYKDAKELEKILPNVASSNAVGYDNFNHLDFLWSPVAKSLVYEHIIKK